MTLTLDNVSKIVGSETHIDNVSLELMEGGFNVLLGRTLAGKTTLMRLMTGLDRPTRGRVLVDGRDVTGLGVRKRDVAMVYQQFINYPSLTCYNNIASPLKLAGLGKAEVDQRVHEEAERLHIEHLLDRLPSELSGGQQQRVALARAFAKGAPFLFLDEPLANLDYKLREDLRNEMRQMFGSGGRTTVVYATTEPQEVLMLGGNVAVLDKGRLLQSGPALDVYHRPATMAISKIFSDPPINLIRAQIDAKVCRLLPDVTFPPASHMGALPPDDYWVGVRANYISLADPGDRATAIPVSVELAEINGSETYIHAQYGKLTLIALIEGVHDFRFGETIRFYLDPERLFVFDMAGKLVAVPGQATEKRRVG
jgi:glycerol transport system ATP-binding protein